METKKIPKELKIFTVIMNLEGSIQLWKAGIQAFERSKGRNKDYFGSMIKYHKKPEEREWKECDDSSRRSHHPYYI
jgi:hypothetical protein